MADNKTGFFNDLNKYLIGIVSGFLSIVTVVSYFLNNIEKFFGISFKYGYGIFIFLYFIFPVLFSFFFYYFYKNGFRKTKTYSIEDRKKKEQHEKEKIIYKITYLTLLAGLPLIFIYLMFPSAAQIPMLVCLILMALIIVVYTFSYVYSFKKDQADLIEYRFYKQKILTEKSMILKEYFILFVILSIGFLMLTKNFKRESWHYTSNQQSECLSYLDLLKKAYKPFFITKSEEETNKALYEFQLAYAFKTDNCYYQKSKFLLDSLDNHLDSINKAFKVLKNQNISFTRYDSGIYLQKKNIYLKRKALDIANKILYSVISDKTSDELLELIHSLQLRSLSWFYFLFLLALSLWVILSLKLSYEENFSLSKSAKKINSLTEDIGSLKSFIYVLLMLCIPFFKPVTKDNIDIDKPFINLSLDDLFHGGEIDSDNKLVYNPNIEINIPPLDTTKLPTDSLLAKIYNLLVEEAKVEYSNDDEKRILKAGGQKP